MTQECQEHEDCMEVPLEVEIHVAGYPIIERLEGFAVSLENESRLDFVGYLDANGDRVELDHNEQDGFKRAAYSALMKEARRPVAAGLTKTWVEAEFDDAFYVHRAGKRTQAQADVYAFRAGG